MAVKEKFNLSFGEQSPAGRFVYQRLIRDEMVTNLLKVDQYYISTFNGGEHTLVLHVSPEDFVALLGIIENLHGDKPGFSEFQAKVQEFLC